MTPDLTRRQIAASLAAAAAGTIGGALADKLSGNGDASALELSAPSPAGQPATVGQILGARYSLAQEGGWGASQADNDRIFQAALARSADTGQPPIEIETPMGTWPLTVPRSLGTTKPFRLRGAGRGPTRLIVGSGGQSLLTLQQQTPGAQVAVEGIEFVASAPGVATPLVLSYAGTPQGPSPFFQYSTLTLRDLSFVGSDHQPTKGVNCFLNGIDIANCWAPIIDSIHFTGSVENQRTSRTGITLRYSFGTQFSNLFVYYATRGIYDPGGATNGQNSEGTAWRSGEIIGVDYGVDLVGSDADPGLFISQVHVNAAKACIRTVYKSQVEISGVLLYKLINDASDFNALDIQNAAYGYLSHIQVGDSRIANAGGAFTGLKLTNSTGMTINGIQAQGWQNPDGSLVYLAGTTDMCRFRGIDASLVAGLNPVGFDPAAGKGNRFFDTLPAVEQGLAVNSATPSVGNDRSGQWYTANTQATTITNFLDGIPGQAIYIVPHDANTSVAHGTNVRLKTGSGTLAIPVGTQVGFIRRGAAWFQI